MKSLSKPFVRWDGLDSVVFGGSTKFPGLCEVSLKLSDRNSEELEITEYRRLICESHKFFTTFSQNRNVISDEEDNKPDIQNLSLTEAKKMCSFYAELLQSVILEKTEAQSIDERDQHFLNEIRVFEMVLSLSSLVIFGSCGNSQTGLCYELAEWIKVRQPCGQQLRDSCLKTMPPNRSEDFWPAVICLLIVGDLYGAIHLLRLHESSHLEEFTGVLELLEAFARLHADLAGLAEEQDQSILASFGSPGQRSRSGSVLTALQQTWQSLTEAAGNFVSKMAKTTKNNWNAKLLLITEMLAGKESAFSEIKLHCDAWYQLLVPRLLYIDPFVTCQSKVTTGRQGSYDLAKHAKWCLGFYFGATPALLPSDSLFYSLFSKDLCQLAKGVGENFSNWWLLAHLLDLLQLSNQVLESGGWLLASAAPASASKQAVHPQLTLHGLSELRRFAVLEYALSLANDCDLWPIAASYVLATTGSISIDSIKSNNPSGPELASFLIHRAVRRFPSSETLDRALSVSNRLGLRACYADLCTAEANRLFKVAVNTKPNDYEFHGCKREWLLLSAISWAARPGYAKSAQNLADSIACELLTSTSCKVLNDEKSDAIWETLYSTAVGALSSSTPAATSSLPFLNLTLNLYQLHKASPDEAIQVLSKMMTSVVSAGVLSESNEKAENLNGLVSLKLRSILQKFVSTRQLGRFSDSFLLSLAKCVRDVSCLPQRQVKDDDLDKLLMIIVRQNTSSW